jgi:hypothetical protein
MARDGNFTGKPETRWVWGMGEDFDPHVQPAPDPKFHGCGCGFYFNPRVTRTRPEIQFILYFA